MALECHLAELDARPPSCTESEADPDFVSFMDARGAETITAAVAMEWITKIGKQPTWSIRLTDVRCFAQHLAHFDPATEVPPPDAVPIARRVKPYIHSDAEIEALLAAALAIAAGMAKAAAMTARSTGGRTTANAICPPM